MWKIIISTGQKLSKRPALSSTAVESQDSFHLWKRKNSALELRISLGHLSKKSLAASRAPMEDQTHREKPLTWAFKDKRVSRNAAMKPGSSHLGAGGMVSLATHLEPHLVMCGQSGETEQEKGEELQLHLLLLLLLLFSITGPIATITLSLLFKSGSWSTYLHD